MIRYTREEDISIISKLNREFIYEIGYIPIPSLRERILQKESIVLVRDENIIGFANFHLRKDGIITIYEIAIKKEYQSRGNGKKLIEYILNNIGPYIQLKCPVDNSSNKFYNKIGKFICCEEGKKRRLNKYIILKDEYYERILCNNK